MRETRKGQDRVTMQELRTRVGGIKQEMDIHVSHCYTCHGAGSDVYSHCKEWWRIAVDLHRARKRLAHMELPYEPTQEPLPGM